MDAGSYSREIRRAKSPEDQVAWFGAMLARETGTAVEIVGGSAIEIYLGSANYVSQDIDILGDRGTIENVLLKWRFQQVKGRSHRSYWTDNYIGLVDFVGLADRSGLAPSRIETPYGDVLLSAPEPLIIRRLSRSKRESSPELFDQAVALAELRKLDWDYLDSEARFEHVEAELAKLRRKSARRTSSRGRTARPKVR